MGASQNLYGQYMTILNVSLEGVKNTVYYKQPFLITILIQYHLFLVDVISINFQS